MARLSAKGKVPEMGIEQDLSWMWDVEHRPQKRPRTVSLTAYVTMLVATNLGWAIGTLLCHWLT